jgi:hypothetical protein
MFRRILFALACVAGVLSIARAAEPTPAPQRAAAGPGDQTFKSAILSAEPYEPKTELPAADRAPNCQIKIGEDWSETPTRTLDECAALLDQKAPAQPKPMSTAYWNEQYLSADDKNIYQAAPQSSAWTVLRPRRAQVFGKVTPR